MQLTVTMLNSLDAGTFADTCKCPSACDKVTATCPTKVGGNWTAILVPASACVDDPVKDVAATDYTGAIVGGVVGGEHCSLHSVPSILGSFST
jgi:hypothetical protein